MRVWWPTGSPPPPGRHSCRVEVNDCRHRQLIYDVGLSPFDTHLEVSTVLFSSFSALAITKNVDSSSRTAELQRLRRVRAAINETNYACS